MKEVKKFLFSIKIWHHLNLINFTLVKPLKTKLYPSDLKTQYVPRSKHFLTRVMKPDKLTLYTEIIAVCSEIHEKHTNALWE
jgi:hypothetical protein